MFFFLEGVVSSECVYLRLCKCVDWFVCMLECVVVSVFCLRAQLIIACMCVFLVLLLFAYVNLHGLYVVLCACVCKCPCENACVSCVSVSVIVCDDVVVCVC